MARAQLKEQFSYSSYLASGFSRVCWLSLEENDERELRGKMNKNNIGCYAMQLITI
jgi:hypothetical protein